MKHFIKDFFSKFDQIRSLVTCTEEILNENIFFVQWSLLIDSPQHFCSPKPV